MPLSKSRPKSKERREAYDWFWEKMEEADLSLRKLSEAAEEMGESLAGTTVVHWFRAERGEKATNPNAQNILLLARIFQSRGVDVTEEDIRYQLGLSTLPPVSREDRQLLNHLHFIEQHDPARAQAIRERMAKLRREYEESKAQDEGDCPNGFSGLASAALS
jgi:hypothetical protein